MAAKGTRNKKIEATEAQTVLMNVKNLNMNDLVKSCGDLQLTLQSTLAGLQTQFTNKMSQLEELDEAISLKQARLKELHEIENEAVRVDEVRALKEEAENEYHELKAERDKQWKEQEVERHKTWQREGEEWAYKFLQQQKKAKDEWDAEIAQRRRNEEARQVELQKSWTDREGTILAREQEYESLKAQVATFDALVKSEVAKAEKIVTNSLQKHHDYETAALKKDMLNEKNMADLRCQSYEKTIAGLNEEIKDLKVQLTAARHDANTIAAQALQSASGRQVAEALQRVVDTGRDSQTKNK